MNETRMPPRVTVGLERLLRDPAEGIAQRRFALLANQASVDDCFRYSWDLLSQRFPGRLAMVFSPQHGLWCEQQANMIESGHGTVPGLQVPLVSLYSETREPSVELLKRIDLLVIDLQDVGTRIYTFIWTILNCLRACARAEIPVLLLDRPNPLGGVSVEGPLVASDHLSFVGGWTIPMRHGLTLGELCRLLTAEMQIPVPLEVRSMDGWSRDMGFADTGRRWLPTSPNVPTLESLGSYPGLVLLEGTNLSEGRGTTTPFEICGAPFIDPDRLTGALCELALPGVIFRPIRFQPTFDKWSQQSCGGVALHVTDPDAYQPYRTAVGILAAVHSMWPDPFQFLPPPYEYEYHKPPIDILSGSARLREALQSSDRLSASEIEGLAQVDTRAWWRRVEPYLLYDRGTVARPQSPDRPDAHAPANLPQTAARPRSR